METYDSIEVERLTGYSKRTRDELVRYYGKLPEAVRIGIHAIQPELIRDHRGQKTKGKETEFFYALFLIAVRTMKGIETGEETKRELTDDELRKIEFIRRSRIKSGHGRKASPLRKVIEVQFFELIRKLREEGLSWRDISDYIARFHKRRISHSYLKLTYEAICIERESMLK